MSPRAKKQKSQNNRRSPVSPRKPNGERRHNSPYAGKFLVKVSKDNPRREGTAGYKSWEKLKGGKVKYEAAVEAGARPVDIRWDVEHGNLKVVAK